MNSETGNENQERKRLTPRGIPQRRDHRIWEPRLCIHVGNCFRGLPLVFQPQVRPWCWSTPGMLTILPGW